MRNVLILMCGMVMLSTVALADDTTETCANGAGTVVVGAVTGHKYCRSNQEMNWWNAYAWCDGLDRKLVEASDCACSDELADCANKKCPEFLKAESTDHWVHTGTADLEYPTKSVICLGTRAGTTSNNHPKSRNLYVLCK